MFCYPIFCILPRTVSKQDSAEQSNSSRPHSITQQKKKKKHYAKTEIQQEKTYRNKEQEAATLKRHISRS
jgi:hypothetical protein